MKIIAAMLFAALVTGACSTPEPRVVFQEKDVAVPVPCTPNLGPRPALMTKDQIRVAIEGAANLDDEVKILVSQALLYVGWVPVLEAGLAACGERKANAGG